jgi:hypothetical protein
MFISRRLNPTTNAIELWRCEWENQMGASPRKVHLEKVADETPLSREIENHAPAVPAICWSYGRTLGNIAVFSQSLLGRFPAATGDDAALPCEFVDAGKFRNGVERWWCRTHQTHWGTKGDHAAFEKFGEMRCANHMQLLSYVVSPLTVNLDEHAEIGVWCSMPAAISTEHIEPRPPKIHVHVRPEVNGKKIIDRDFRAISMVYSDHMGLFGSDEITRVNITPPAAFDFVSGLESGREMGCINCGHCGYPHLDLGDFALKAHRKHFCGNCGFDSTWSPGPIVSTPLKPLHDRFAKTLKYETPNRSLDLDQYGDCTHSIWASTPAILWTAERPQEFGIHVHVHDGPKRIIDDTFGSVILGGKPLDRSALVQAMIRQTVV